MDDATLFGSYSRARSAGETVRSIAAALQISPFCVTKWKNLRRETGGVSPGKIGGHKKPVLSGANADWLRRRIRSGPFTLRKLTLELAERGIKTDVRAVWTFVHAEGLSFKKTILPAEQGRPDIARMRVRWKAHQSRIDASRPVFIDETWIKTNMAPLRGWGPSGQRLAASAPFGHWNCGAALRSDQRALGYRWPHQWRAVQALCREGVGVHPVKGPGSHSRQPPQSRTSRPATPSAPRERPTRLLAMRFWFRKAGWWAHQGSNLGPAD